MVGECGSQLRGEMTDKEEKAVARRGGTSNQKEVSRIPPRGCVRNRYSRRVEGTEEIAAVEKRTVDAARVGRVEMNEIIAELAQRGGEAKLGKHVGVLDLGEADDHRRVECHKGLIDVVALEVETTGRPVVCSLRGEGVVVGQGVVAGVEEVFDIPKNNPLRLRLPYEKREEQRQEGQQ